MARHANTRHIHITPSRQGFGPVEKAKSARFNRRSDIDQKHADRRLAEQLKEVYE